MSTWRSIYFINSNSPLISKIINLHDYIIMFITIILSSIIVLLLTTAKKSPVSVNFKEDQTLEIIWTTLPILILILIALPSLKTLYCIEENNPSITIKATGHQWYWSYAYPELSEKEFDRYIKPSEGSSFRLIQADNSIKIPYILNTRLLVSSEDVIHSWTIPSLALKRDAIPGRINQISIWNSRPGVFFGQCSEICGANHSFMPITIEVINLKSFTRGIFLNGWKFKQWSLKPSIVLTFVNIVNYYNINMSNLSK